MNIWKCTLIYGSVYMYMEVNTKYLIQYINITVVL